MAPSSGHPLALPPLAVLNSEGQQQQQHRIHLDGTQELQKIQKEVINEFLTTKKITDSNNKGIFITNYNITLISKEYTCYLLQVYLDIYFNFRAYIYSFSFESVAILVDLVIFVPTFAGLDQDCSGIVMQ